MRQHIMALAVVAASGCGALAPHTSNTQQLAGAHCEGIANVDQQVAALYAPGNIDNVEPLYRTQQFARTPLRYTAGATLYVPAPEGVTPAYLERVLSCHAISQAAGQPNDPLLAQHVRDVDVTARGQYFVIEIEGVDRAAGHEIFERARSLHQPNGSVGVRQLSSSETSNAKF